jgi:hypothetical protein
MKVEQKPFQLTTGDQVVDKDHFQKGIESYTMIITCKLTQKNKSHPSGRLSNETNRSS